MTDIRNFFMKGGSGGGSSKPQKPAKKPEQPQKRKRLVKATDIDEGEEDSATVDRNDTPSPVVSKSTKKSPIVLDDDEDDVEIPKKKPKTSSTSSSSVKTKPIPKPKEEPKKLEETNVSSFFGSARVAQKANDKVSVTKIDPVKKEPKTKSRSSSKKTSPVKPENDDDFDDLDFDLNDIDDAMLDANTYSQSQGNDSQPQEVAVEEKPVAKQEIKEEVKEESKATPKKTSTPSRTTKRKAMSYVESDDEEEEEEFKPKKKATPGKTVKRKPMQYEEESSADEEEEPKPKKKATPKKPTPAKPKPEVKEEEEKPKKKFDYQAMLARRAAGPKAPGSKPIPIGAEGCLAGKTFVFTGELESMDRDAAKKLVEKYGARVTGAPSQKTSYVVAGEDAGEKKLEKAREKGVKIISEDDMFELIRASNPNGGYENSKAAPPSIAMQAGVSTAMPMKMPVPTSAPVIKQPSTSLQLSAPIQPAAPPKPKPLPAKALGVDTQLWTDKYAPKTMSDLVGNQANYKRLSDWLRTWDPNEGGSVESGKGKQKDGGTFKAALLSGNPGIGKTSSAHVIAKQEGYDIIEFNASDTRSKKSLKEKVKETIDNRSMSEFFKSGNQGAEVKKRNKMCLIMDECDGMSSGDRGGMAELILLIKKTKVPIICICNDRQSPKVRSLANHCLDLKFVKPQVNQISKRIEEICRKEGLKLGYNALNNLVESTNADIRQILNMLQTYSLGQSSLSYDQSMDLGKISEKDMTLGIFDIQTRLLDGFQFRKHSFEDRFGYYFHDYSMIPLMVQENYLKNTPQLAYDVAQNEQQRSLEVMKLMSNAADSISDGDLIDRLIHSDGNWTLMPVHAIFSTVRPSFFSHGRPWANTAWGAYTFPSWLGKNSSQGKNYRTLREMHMHMRLHVTADATDIRQTYLPTLAARLTNPLVEQGANGVDEVIKFMDGYYLTREDWDTVTELGVGKLEGKKLLKQIDTQAKSSFTRTYNKMSHPTAIITTTVTKASSKGRTERPDFEDVVDDEDESALLEDDDEDENSSSSSIEDKSIKMKGGSKKAGSSGAKKGKASASDGAKSKGKGRSKSKA